MSRRIENPRVGSSILSLGTVKQGDCDVRRVRQGRQIRQDRYRGGTEPPRLGYGVETTHGDRLIPLRDHARRTLNRTWRQRETPDGPEKWCGYCDGWWPVECYIPHPRTLDRLDNRCDACRAELKARKRLFSTAAV